jgi:hypothetical protein
VKFVGKISDEWPTAQEAAELTAAQRLGLRSGRRVQQCLPGQWHRPYGMPTNMIMNYQHCSPRRRSAWSRSMS